MVSLVSTPRPEERGLLVFARDPSTRPVRLGSDAGVFAEGVDSLTKAQLQERLMLEKRLFMTKMSIRRIEHARRYATAAMKIQSFYRGYLVRKHWNEISEACRTRKVIRQLIRGKHHKSLVVSQSRFSYRLKCKENHSAECIQKHFRRFLQVVRDRKDRVSTHQLDLMATRIQSLRRRSKARHRTTSIVYERYFAHHTRIRDMGPFQLSVIYRTTTQGLNVAAAVIQRVVRRRARERSEELQRVQAMIYFARQRNACRIQAVFRGYRVRKHFIALGASVTRLQCLVRCFLARTKVARVRGERLELLRRQRDCAIRLQKVIRSAYLTELQI